jgi:hypothetical protein
MSEDKFKKFIDLLDQNYTWPDYYFFKFIVPVESKEVVLSHLEGYQIELKESNKGNYVSITAKKIITHSQEVIVIYEKISTIKGVLSL